MAIAANAGGVPSNDAKGENLLKANESSVIKYCVDGLKSNTKVVRTWMKFPDLIGNPEKKFSVVIPAIAEYIAGNVATMQSQNAPYKGAPPRSLMPQTDKDGKKGQAWQKTLKSGELNFIEPTEDDVK
jgi:hypothetical protein